MKTRNMLFLSSVLALAWGASAEADAAVVDVTFVHPERYTDANLRGDYRTGADDIVLGEIRQYLQRLGSRYLRPGETLTVEVLDIDLAGRYEPWHPLAYDTRFMRGVTWPRIDLRYRLEEGGRVTGEAVETVADRDYETRAAARLSHDPLRFEKDMLGDWFRARFSGGRLPPRG